MKKANQACRPMLSEKRRETLGKMYSLVGSHSAVKLCRWQKSMMRGRGGCYKWTMYGIRSHQCMEATPSMACANKCTFCWRHGTNPTTKEWKWDFDEPIPLVDGMIEQHQALIQNSCGMPGVTDKTLKEARMPRHCALSLVGEPIIYPKFNDFLARLHQRDVSTFVVNNGQFPDALAALGACTQVYLSVDGPDKDKMKKLDRPIFEDFWDRFNSAVDLMSKRRDRTVFRLTLIKNYNMDDADISNYQKLMENGAPDLIELKQLTPSFNRSTSILSIENVPTWEEIVAFGQKLCDACNGGTRYKIACAHEHSSCLLLARADKYFINNKWHTWIDFDKFHDLVKERVKLNEDGSVAEESLAEMRGLGALNVDEYMLETPEWAVFGSQDGGFDPEQERHISRKRALHLEREKQKRQDEATEDEATA